MTKDRASIIAKLAAGLSDADRNCGAATRPSSPPPTSWSASDLVEGGGGGAPAGALPRDLRSWAFDDHEGRRLLPAVGASSQLARMSASGGVVLHDYASGLNIATLAASLAGIPVARVVWRRSRTCTS